MEYYNTARIWRKGCCSSSRSICGDYGRKNQLPLWTEYVILPCVLPGNYVFGQTYGTMTVFELLLEGDMQVEIDGDRFCIQPGEIIVIPPGKTVLREVRKTCRKVVFGICGLLHQALLAQLSLQPYSVFRVKEPERVLGLLQELYRLLELKDPGFVPRMSGLTVELLMEISREVAASPEPLLADVLRFLECNLAGSVTLAALSARFHVSIDSLNRLFLKKFGVPTKRYLTGLRMELAASLLEMPDITVLQVSQRTGYRNQFSFSREFRKKYGMPPLAYRKKYGRK